MKTNAVGGFGKLILFFIILIGPLFQLIPINDVYLYRLTSAFIIILALVSLEKDYFFYKYIIKISIFSLLICSLAIVFKFNFSIFIQIILSGILGYLVYSNILSSKTILMYILILSIYFVTYYIINGDINNSLNIYLGTSNKEGLSRNYIGILLLQSYLLYYAISIKNNIKPYHWPILLMLLISFLSSGISSALVFSVLFIGYLIINFKVQNKYYYLIIIIITISLIIIDIQEIFSNVELYSRIEEGTTGVDRVNLINDFYTKLNSQSILYGFDNLSEFSPSSGYEYSSTNIHNSYLNLFKDIGFLSIFYWILCIYLLFKLYDVNLMLAFIYLMVLVRALSDGYLFSSYVIDFIIFYCINQVLR